MSNSTDLVHDVSSKLVSLREGIKLLKRKVDEEDEKMVETLLELLEKSSTETLEAFKDLKKEIN